MLAVPFSRPFCFNSLAIMRCFTCVYCDTYDFRGSISRCVNVMQERERERERVCACVRACMCVAATQCRRVVLGLHLGVGCIAHRSAPESRTKTSSCVCVHVCKETARNEPSYSTSMHFLMAGMGGLKRCLLRSMICCRGEGWGRGVADKETTD